MLTRHRRRQRLRWSLVHADFPVRQGRQDPREQTERMARMGKTVKTARKGHQVPLDRWVHLAWTALTVLTARMVWTEAMAYRARRDRAVQQERLCRDLWVRRDHPATRGLLAQMESRDRQGRKVRPVPSDLLDRLDPFAVRDSISRR